MVAAMMVATAQEENGREEGDNGKEEPMHLHLGLFMIAHSFLLPPLIVPYLTTSITTNPVFRQP